MAAWFSAVAPFLPDIIRMAQPIFTRDKDAAKVPEQIKELQDAAAQNAGALGKLAAEMQHTLALLQQGSAQLETTLATLQARNDALALRLERNQRLCWVAATAALLAFAMAAYALSA